VKRILILGAGHVAPPLIKYLLQQPELEVTVASQQFSSQSMDLLSEIPHRVELDVQDDEQLSRLLSTVDVTVSLLPFTFHPHVAHHCLRHSSHLVTTSYVSQDMQNLDVKAKEAGLVFLNEAGLDPGIDHMSAMALIDAIHDGQGTVKSFESCCGGLPAPESNDNPLGYKFSWSPRGVLMATKNPARFRRHNHLIEVPSQDLFKHIRPREINGVGELEMYPNRDSMVYKDLYRLKESETLFRGTLRYPGWCQTMNFLTQMGFLDETLISDAGIKTYRQLTGHLLGLATEDDPEKAILKRFNIDTSLRLWECLRWLGILEDKPLFSYPVSPLQALTDIMLERMAYRPGERDMIVLQHDIIYAKPAEKDQHIRSLLVLTGEAGKESAMARTVGLPAAVAAHLIALGEINIPGVLIPTEKAIYKPILNKLRPLGITFKETLYQNGVSHASDR
jgi:saccharopine dehydrogenase (NADP+, L-glutamate forming)/spermidine synthase